MSCSSIVHQCINLENVAQVHVDYVRQAKLKKV